MHGPYTQSELDQAVRLQPQLEPGMLLLADRGYIGLELWWSAVRTGPVYCGGEVDDPVAGGAGAGGWLVLKHGCRYARAGC